GWSFEISNRDRLHDARVAVAITDPARKICAADHQVSVPGTTQDRGASDGAEDLAAQIAWLRAIGKSEEIHVLLEYEKRILFRQGCNGGRSQTKLIFAGNVTGGAGSPVAP